MKINSLLYALKQGLKGMAKNKIFSIVSTATMSACIFLFGVFYIVVVNFSATMKHMEESVSVTVFFEQDLNEEQIQTIGKQIQADKGTMIKEMKFVSAEEAWEEFKTIYFEGHEDLADAFVDDNPLQHSANYQIKMNDITKQNELVAYLKNISGVREVKQAETVADTFTDMNKMIAYISGAIIVVLLCVAIFLISNTISVGISVRKEEIGIMKLVGATDFLVRAPFVFEGIVIGLIGAAIPLLLLFLLYEQVIEYIAKQFNLVASMMVFVPAQDLFRVLFPVALGLGVGIGLLGSMFTVRKHIRV